MARSQGNGLVIKLGERQSGQRTTKEQADYDGELDEWIEAGCRGWKAGGCFGGTGVGRGGRGGTARGVPIPGVHGEMMKGG